MVVEPLPEMQRKEALQAAFDGRGTDVEVDRNMFIAHPLHHLPTHGAFQLPVAPGIGPDTGVAQTSRVAV